MPKPRDNSPRTSRRKFVRSAIVGIGTIPFASLDTRAKTQTQPEEKQTSPIIIGGGGSVGLDFDTSVFVGDLSAGKVARQHDTIHKLWLIDKYGALNNIPFGHPKCTITVLCRRRRHETRITIEGDPLGINFDPREFRYDYPPDGVKRIFHNTKHKIIKITVYDQVTQQEYPPYEPPTKGRCTLVVVDTL